jgi:hypothetical protein
VRIILGLGILAGACLALNWWSSHRTAKPRAVAAKSPPTAAKSRELRREVFVYNRRIPNGTELPERPPRWTPGPLEAPAPTHSVLAVDSALDGVDLFELYAETAMGYAPLVAPPASLLMLDEVDLLAELGDDSKSRHEEWKVIDQNYPTTRRRPIPRSQAVVTIDLDDGKGTADRLRTMVQRETVRRARTRLTATLESERESRSWAADNASADTWLALVDDRSDLRMLPFLRGARCNLAKQSAVVLGQTSQFIGQNLAGTTVTKYVHDWARWYEKKHDRLLPEPYRGVQLSGDVATSFLNILSAKIDWSSTSDSVAESAKNDQLVPALAQIMQGREESDRRVLVEAVASIRGPNATAILAQRALFELSADVRRAAVAALAKRSAADYRSQLLGALRYPWPAIADHAATALIAVGDKGAIPELVKLLDKSDPAAPFINVEGRWAVRELVRVNHLRNCLLCHAPSLSKTDPVRGLIPIPGQRIGPQYYQELDGIFVRADITYLRQDFSLTHPVKDHGLWPEHQRFDYFVRTRELTKEEIVKRGLPMEDIGRRQPLGDQDYPQREAVLYALRELTGQDFGRASEDWRVLVRK